MGIRTEKEVLINRTQMITIAWHHNFRISRSTIHRWANEPEFPLVVGIDGRNLLYARSDFIDFLEKKLNRIKETH